MILKWPASFVFAILVFIFLSALIRKIPMLSKRPLFSYETTFGYTLILGRLYRQRTFINYERKANETNISRLAMVFNVSEYVGEYVSQYKMM